MRRDADGRTMSLSQAARALPGRPHTRTLVRWILGGVIVRYADAQGAKHRQRVRLAARKIGGCWYVTEAELERFIAECTPPPQRERKPEPLATRRSRMRHRGTMRDLAELDLLPPHAAEA